MASTFASGGSSLRSTCRFRAATSVPCESRAGTLLTMFAASSFGCGAASHAASAASAPCSTSCKASTRGFIS
eukprot:CAMPEP_0183799660 /NCGR_PEP_ID=MMETSP0803_2-20130417/22378_1 /TAXON_ID=195967 /ORGANISM="Crustomastix stigmata, Strain CCMP3273" /LENGTH=71 /DNA_ID=CAMNT_0026044365 /DNA_START=456 /DNA_END=668 /DNA_ORIENTATION=-